MFRVETLQKKHNIPIDDLYANFHLLLGGPAQEWYWLYMEENADSETNHFSKFRLAFLDQFRRADCDEEIRSAMNERKQGQNETFDEFYAVIKGMSFTMKNKIPEQSLVNIIRRNLKPRIKNLIFGCKIERFEQLKKECKRAEKHLSEFENRPKYGKKLEEVSWLEEEPGDELSNTAVEALERRPGSYNTADDRRKNLSNVGHLTSKEEKKPQCPCDSPFHRLSCFKCNQPNLKCFICERCESENRKHDDQPGVSRRNSAAPEK